MFDEICRKSLDTARLASRLGGAFYLSLHLIFEKNTFWKSSPYHDTIFRPGSPFDTVKTNVFLTRHAFHTLYAVLCGPRRRKIHSCLGVVLTSHVQFSKRGFKHYLQHFVKIVVGSSRLSLKYFTFGQGCILGGASYFRLFCCEPLFD